MVIDIELYEEISNITQTDYKPNYPKDPDEDRMLVYEVESMLEDLLAKYKELEKKYDETERYYIENWQPIPVSKQVGVVDKDFY